MVLRIDYDTVKL